MTSNPVYDQIGFQYNQTRKADPFIAGQLWDLLEVELSKKYLDLGCGTGNYLKALLDKYTDIYGVDPSDTMLQEARTRGLMNRVFKGESDKIPFPGSFFKGTIAVLTTHHWPNLLNGFSEIHRCLEEEGILVIFTFTPDQVNHYWLKEYFPKMIEGDSQKIPDLENLRQTLKQSGFKVQEERIYWVQDDLQDQFMYSHKNHPEKYLLEEIRKGISAFRLAKDQNEIQKGLEQIRRDIESGDIQKIIDRYTQLEFGDYIFIKAQKI